MTGTCLVCGKEYEKNIHNQKVCSKPCRKKLSGIILKNWYSRNKRVRLCVRCEKVINEPYQRRYHKECMKKYGRIRGRNLTG